MASKAEETRARAEQKFDKGQKAMRESDKVWAQYEAEGRAVRAKTERLKLLRLAKEAAETEAAAQRPVVKKPAARKAKVSTA